MSGEHSKLGIINRFHRTLRELITKVLTHYQTNKWYRFIDRILDNYNSRIHRTTGMAPDDMTLSDVVRLNTRLRKENKPSVVQLLQFRSGDRVRVLFRKDKFDKGGHKYSKKLYTVVGRRGYNIRITDGTDTYIHKHWELLKI